MPEPRNELPDSAALRRGLVAVLGDEIARRGGFAALQRRRNPAASTFASEKVDVLWRDDSSLALFVKYGDRLPAADVTARTAARGGVAYEAAVLRELAELGDGTPRLRGSYEPPGGGTWLFTDWIPGACGLGHRGVRDLPAAAAWLGRFHATATELLRRRPLPWLRRHDAAWFAGWLERGLARVPLAGDDRRPDGLDAILGHYVPLLEWHLQRVPGTVVHGEPFPSNLLLAGGAGATHLVGVDWECAAVSLAGLDLAALTSGWGPAASAACIGAYARARFGAAAPPPWFHDELALMRVHWSLRWLAEASPAATAAKTARLLAALEAAVEELAASRLGRERAGLRHARDDAS